ncbi:hypothetical protein [Persicirhabdus sediminis]|uniref:Uncharacterized protein n=1 Tax=Persicirhabdus sediminis TaxID=454144 RepID=A0A8J7SGN8_9BACT|nr:hypothetical protein [Persicirhabdus sediminis]MBK1790230.1 hypothetical protein [Persicirhabdus sediminis]
MKLKKCIFPLVAVMAVSSCDKGGSDDASQVDAPAEAKTEAAAEVADTSEVAPAAASVSRHEEIADQVLNAMTDFADEMLKVKDMETAQAAKVELDKIGDRFTALSAELEKMELPDAELKTKISKKMEARESEIEAKMGDKMQNMMLSLDADTQTFVQGMMMEFFGKVMVAGEQMERHFSMEEAAAEPAE